MNKHIHHSCLLLFTAFVAVAGSVAARAAQPDRPPNILIIFADDMGYAEMGCQGNKDVPTPNLDSLAKNGVRFTNGYVSCPICAPTRAGLLTGRYQQRFGFETNPGQEAYADEKFGLPHDMLYWRFHDQHAIRRGDWKLVQTRTDPKPQLYNLANDIGEATDLAGKEPAKFKELNDAWAAWNVQLMAPQWRREDSRTQGAGKTTAKGTRRGGGIEQRFNQWDKNGDGKLAADEVPGEKLFKMLDKNGDGVVTKEEANAFGGRGGRAAGSAMRRSPDPAPAATDRSPASGRPAPNAAILPPAENFKPRPHGDEARAVGLKLDVLAKIDVEMQRHVAAPDVAGVIALIHKNGVRGYFEAFGMQDIEAAKSMPKDAIFRLQSMSKPVVTVGALTLLDEGKFTFDEPISQHLPEWAEPKVLENGQLVRAKHPITPRMLMSHSSGLYYGDIVRGSFRGGATTRDARTTLQAHSKALAAKPLKFHPGEGYSYGASIDVLGRYIEAVSGKPLDEFLEARVLKPLKMTDTGFWVPKDKAERIAQLYTQRPSGKLERGRGAAQVTNKPKLLLGGQGLCSTAEDYARFCQMILNRGELDGTRILKP